MSVGVTGLMPGYDYSFRVAATNAAGNAEAHIWFKTAQLGAYATMCPVKTEPSPEDLEGDRKYAEGAPAREAEQQRAAKEQAEREATSKAPSQSPARITTQPTAETDGGLSLAGTTIALQQGRVSLVKLECLSSASCRGKLTLLVNAVAKASGRHTRARPATIGVASVSIAGDEIKTVRVDLDAAGRALLRANHGRLRARVAILELAPSPRERPHKERLSGAAQDSHRQRQSVRLIRKLA